MPSLPFYNTGMAGRGFKGGVSGNRSSPILPKLKSMRGVCGSVESYIATCPCPAPTAKQVVYPSSCSQPKNGGHQDKHLTILPPMCTMLTVLATGADGLSAPCRCTIVTFPFAVPISTWLHGGCGLQATAEGAWWASCALLIVTLGRRNRRFLSSAHNAQKAC